MNDENGRGDTRRTGRMMVYGAWLLALGLLTLFFNDWQERQRNPNRSHESRVTQENVREVALKRNRYGHYVATGKINGQSVIFLVDTGATSISVPGEVARRLQLEPGLPYEVNTANGTARVFATRLGTVELGNIRLTGIRGNINPNMSGEEILLGMSALKNLEWTQSGEVLTLRQFAQ